MMGGLGPSRGRSRGRRGAYYAENEDVWTSESTTNPAVIE